MHDLCLQTLNQLCRNLRLGLPLQQAFHSSNLCFSAENLARSFARKHAETTRTHICCRDLLCQFALDQLSLLLSREAVVRGDGFGGLRFSVCVVTRCWRDQRWGRRLSELIAEQ